MMIKLAKNSLQMCSKREKGAELKDRHTGARFSSANEWGIALKCARTSRASLCLNNVRHNDAVSADEYDARLVQRPAKLVSHSR